MACSISTLMVSSCSNGFIGIAGSEQHYRAILLQLLCNWSEMP